MAKRKILESSKKEEEKKSKIRPADITKNNPINKRLKMNELLNGSNVSRVTIIGINYEV